MNELGILFQPSMALAIAQGRKTKTRRVIALPKWAKGREIQRDEYGMATFLDQQLSADAWVRCPYAKVAGLKVIGDWRPCYQTGHTARVLTTWAVLKDADGLKPTQLSCGYGMWWDASQGPKPTWAGKSRPGRFAPLGLRHNFPAIQILKVTVERLQDITEEDAVAEGFATDEQDGTTALERFKGLWKVINANRGYGWDVNPWLWCVEFKRITG